MKLHLYTTDLSALGLLFPASDQITAAIVPKNRLETEKVKALTRACPYDVFIHTPGELTTDAAGIPLRYTVDAAVSWMYTQIFPPEMLAKYPRGILNFHAGQPGAHALKRALEAKHKTLRCFWHRCVAEVDAGPVLQDMAIALWPEKPFGNARRAMIEAGLHMFPRAWKDFARASP